MHIPEIKHLPFTNADPRARLLAGMLLVLAVAFTDSRAVLTGVIVLSALLLCRSLKPVLKRLLAVNLLTVFIWLTLPFTVERGASIAALYTLRINACALILMVFIAPMGIGALSNALISLKCPGKLVSILVLTYRWIFVLKDRTATAVTAMQLRRPEKIGALRTLRTYAALFATAIASAALRSERIQQAMMLRGFNGTLPRTQALHWRKGDTVLLTASALLALFLCYIQQCST